MDCFSCQRSSDTRIQIGKSRNTMHGCSLAKRERERTRQDRKTNWVSNQNRDRMGTVQGVNEWSDLKLMPEQEGQGIISGQPLQECQVHAACGIFKTKRHFKVATEHHLSGTRGQSPLCGTFALTLNTVSGIHVVCFDEF